MFGYPEYYYTLRQDTVVYQYIRSDGWNVGYLQKDNYLAGYVGGKIKSRLQDGMLFGVQELDKGKVTFLADDIVFRNFWQNGKLMLCNAVFMIQ